MMTVTAAPPAFFSTDLFVPRYRVASSGRWRLAVAPLSISVGYWGTPYLVQNLVGLLRDTGQGAWDTWMSLAPTELESQEVGCRHARGHTVVMGLGMGWAAANSALNPAVTAVTVVERDPDVLALHRDLDIWSQLPPDAAAKLRVVEGDAYEFVPDRPVDLLMPDIWLPFENEGRLEEVRRMQANCRAAAIYFWGQELVLARMARAAGRDMDEAGLAATVVETGLPLLGPGIPGYAALAQAAFTSREARGRGLHGR